MPQPAPISVPKGYQRLGDFPLDASSVFGTLGELETYASTNGTAYAGQVCAVSTTGFVYVIQNDLSVLQIGAASAGIVSDTPPSTYSEGARWVNSATGRSFDFFGGFWVETGGGGGGSSGTTTGAAAWELIGNSGLALSDNFLSTVYNTTIGDTVMSVSVGGAAASPASYWKSKNIVQVLNEILFPTILASVASVKSTSVSVSGASGTLEVGSSVARTLTATFNRGTILNGTGSVNSNPLVGAATGYTFSGTGISATSQAGGTLTFTAAVVLGSNSWAVTVAHEAGTGAYTDNKGVAGTNLASSRVAGTSSASSSPSVTGVYPYYYLKSASPITAASMAAAIAAGTAIKVVGSSSGTLSIPYSPSAQYFAVAYPASSTTKSTYYVTALDNGAITVVFSPVATQTITTALWSQSYKIHVSATALTNSNSIIELRN